MSSVEEERRERKKELEKERAVGLLQWHARLAERLQKEEATRSRCNTQLVGCGFAPVSPKKAARVRDAGIRQGMGRDEVLARVWYAMSRWQSKFDFDWM
jgi:hypothetical protein